MSKHNYSQYSNKNNKQKENEVVEVEETAVAEPEVAAVEPEVTVVDPVVVAEPEPEAPVKPLTGKVSGCTRLNVRKAAVATADVECVIEQGAEVAINKEESTAEFYKVCTASGVEGFCMKRFIVIK